MTTAYAQGTHATLVVTWHEYPPDGPLVDVDNLMITITALADGAIAVGPTSVEVTHPAVGVYTYTWSVPTNVPPGQYIVLWEGDDQLSGEPVTATEIITITAGTAADQPLGVCSTWEPIWTCDLSPAALAVTGAALEIATEILWAFSGRRFGLCTVTTRPCRRECYSGIWPIGWDEYSPGWTYPFPALVNGQWFNLGCGGCSGDCSCSIVSEALLPGPVHEVTEVKVDGQYLTKGTDYRVDDWRVLVRLGGETWPICNDLNLPDTEPGTWSVTFTVGEPVPRLGQVAVGVLAAEVAKAIACDSGCLLPKPVQSLARQGVNMTFFEPNELFANGRTGLTMPDMFISVYNPHKAQRRARVYDIDNSTSRRQLGTS